jgi:transposase
MLHTYDMLTGDHHRSLLGRLKAVGPQIGAVVYHEGLYPTFANRREVASYAGLVATPGRSGTVEREQGISKAGYMLKQVASLIQSA